MKLDPRIKSLSDILTCFDIEKAKQFIGQMGYFAGDLYCFSDVELLCPYDRLVNVFDQDDAFYRGDITFPFFIPECYLKSAERKYRSFQYLKELADAGIEIGKAISIRHKDNDIVILNALVTEINIDAESNKLVDITLGATGYEFATLLNSYLRRVNDAWQPFGVAE